MVLAFPAAHLAVQRAGRRAERGHIFLRHLAARALRTRPRPRRRTDATHGERGRATVAGPAVAVGGNFASRHARPASGAATGGACPTNCVSQKSLTPSDGLT